MALQNTTAREYQLFSSGVRKEELYHICISIEIQDFCEELQYGVIQLNETLQRFASPFSMSWEQDYFLGTLNSKASVLIEIRDCTVVLSS